jgi:hypothetical protein
MQPFSGFEAYGYYSSEMANLSLKKAIADKLDPFHLTRFNPIVR